jgi:drug/metabolite transporter superfamily protein YnfA
MMARNDGRRTRGRRLSTARSSTALALVGAIATLAVAPGRSIAAAGRVQTCGYFSARNFIHRSRIDRWRAYIEGRTSCVATMPVLRIVIDGGGQIHNGPSDATSYTDDNGWRCPAGEMNGQACHLPRHPPYRATAFALDCS